MTAEVKMLRRDFLRAAAAAALVGISASVFVRAQLYPEVEKQENWWSGQTGRVFNYSTLYRIPPPGKPRETGGALELSTPDGLKTITLKWWENWIDWREYDARAWPKPRDRRYFIATGGVCGGCEVSCHFVVWIDKETKLARKVLVNPFAKSNWSLCVRGQSAGAAAAHPDRVVYILSKIDPKTGKRVGVRGDDNFVRITYDESLEIVATYYAKAFYEYFVEGNPLGSMRLHWHEGRPLQTGFFTHHPWTKNWEQQHAFASHTNLCSAGARLGNNLWIAMDRNSPDYYSAKTVVQHGMGHLGDAAHFLMSHGPRLAVARFRGAKVISVREKYFHTELLADYWVAPWPGTEAWLWMAVVNVLINELNAVDWEFIRKWWNWDWFLRDRKLLQHLYNMGYIKTLPPDDIYGVTDDGVIYIKDYERAWSYFQQFLKEYFANFTPEYAAWVTRLNARTPPPDPLTPEEIRNAATLIRAIAKEVATAGKALSVNQWRGPGQTHGGWMLARAFFLLIALTGAVGTVGGTGAASWHNTDFVYYWWKGTLAAQVLNRSLEGPAIWNINMIAPEESAFGAYDPTNTIPFRMYDKEWQNYWRRLGFAVPDRVYVWVSRIANPLATYQAGAQWARFFSNPDLVELNVHMTPFWNEMCYFSDLCISEGFWHERHDPQPAAPGIYAPDRWFSVRWPAYVIYLMREGWRPKDIHRATLEAHQYIGLGDVISPEEWYMEMAWRAIAKAVLMAKEKGRPLDDLLKDKEIDYLGAKVKIPSLADRLAFLIDVNRGKRYAAQLGIAPEELPARLIRDLYEGRITYEQFINDVRRQLLPTLWDMYNWAVYAFSPPATKFAKDQGLEPVEALELYQFLLHDTNVYADKTYLRKVPRDQVARIDPITKLAYDAKGGIVGIEIDGEVYVGFNVLGTVTHTLKLEWYNPAMAEQELREVSIPIIPLESALKRAMEGDIATIQKLINAKLHYVIPIQDFWARIPGLTTGIDVKKGEFVFVANSRFLYQGENSRVQQMWYSFELWPSLYLWMNPIDAQLLGLKTGDTVRVRLLIQALNDLEVASFVTKVWVTPRVREGVMVLLHGAYRWRPAWWDFKKVLETAGTYPTTVVFQTVDIKVDGASLVDKIRAGDFNWRKLAWVKTADPAPVSEEDLEKIAITKLYRQRGMPFWDLAKFVWWKETGTTYDFVLPQTNDPIAWTNMWHFKVRIEKADPKEYGNMEYDFEAGKQAFDFFYKLLTHGSGGELAKSIYDFWRQRWGGLDLKFPRILGVIRGDVLCPNKKPGSPGCARPDFIGMRRTFLWALGIGPKPAKSAYYWPPKVPDLRELP
jgi:anaerobic selenocysteine-containing dehydrogenase